MADVPKTFEAWIAQANAMELAVDERMAYAAGRSAGYAAAIAAAVGECKAEKMKNKQNGGMAASARCAARIAKLTEAK